MKCDKILYDEPKYYSLLLTVFLRILGKFGGRNRKMMIEPQRLEYSEKETPGPAVVVHFPDQSKPIELPLEKVSLVIF